MAKQAGSSEKVEKLERELGRLSLALSIQGELLQRTQEKFNELQKKGNDLVTALKECQTK